LGTFVIGNGLAATRGKIPELEALILDAVRDNPAVSAAATESKAAAMDSKAAKAEWLPSLSARSEVRKIGGTGVLQLDQPIWTFGRIGANIRQADANLAATYAVTDQTKYDIALRTVSAWESYASASLQTEAITAYIRELGDFNSMMARRVAQGVSARIELELVRSRLEQAQVELDGAETTRKLAIARLAQLTGEPFDDAQRVDTTHVDRLLERAEEFDDLSATQLVDASNDYPSVRAAEHKAVAAEEASKSARASRYPSIYLRGVREFGPGRIEANNGVALGLQYNLSASQSIYGWRSYAARAEGAKLKIEGERRLITESLQTEMQTLMGARSRAKSLAAARVGAEAVKQSYARQFIAGRKSWLEVLNALRESELNEVSIRAAHVNTIASYYRLLFLMGMLPWQQPTTGEQRG
jgi:adhesin transport system outer membrane protein